MHQATDQAGAAGLTVAENLLLDELCGRGGRFFVSAASIRRRARAIAALIDLDLPLDRDFVDLRPAERQLIAIARAVAAKASVLILDEPTSSLSTTEAERLFAIIRRLRASGMAILYISHRLGDLAAIADRAVVMRGGRIVGAFARPIDFPAAVAAMIGRTLEAATHDGKTSTAPIIASIKGARLVPGAAPFDLDLRSGEVVAITGTLGSGKSRLLRALFGLETLAQGSFVLDGKPWLSSGPAQSIESGVFMVAEDRWQSSLLPPEVPGASIAGTIALPHLRRWFPSGLLRHRARAQGRHRGDLAARHQGARTRRHARRAFRRQPAKGRARPMAGRTLPAAAARRAVPGRRCRRARRSDRRDPQQPERFATLIATSDTEEALEVADRILVMRNHSLHEAGDGHGSLTDQIGKVESEKGRRPSMTYPTTTQPIRLTHIAFPRDPPLRAVRAAGADGGRVLVRAACLHPLSQPVLDPAGGFGGGDPRCRRLDHHGGGRLRSVGRQHRRFVGDGGELRHGRVAAGRG